jgi:hypothetical protein
MTWPGLRPWLKPSANDVFGGAMNIRMIFRWAWVILILATFSLGCKLVTGVSRAITIATEVNLEGLATEVDLGSLPTKVDLENLMTQVGGIATEIDQGAFETENSVMATQMGAMATDLGLGDLMTQMPVLQGTMMAFVTPSGFPADIPILEGERTFMGGTANQIQYAVQAKVSDAVEFYRREMTARGWSEGSNSQVQADVAVLVFQRGDRKVTVTITKDLFFGAIVSIIIEG